MRVAIADHRAPCNEQLQHSLGRRIACITHVWLKGNAKDENSRAVKLASGRVIEIFYPVGGGDDVGAAAGCLNSRAGKRGARNPRRRFRRRALARHFDDQVAVGIRIGLVTRPTNRAYSSLSDEVKRRCMPISRLWTRNNSATDGTTRVLAAYIQVVGTRA